MKMKFFFHRIAVLALAAVLAAPALCPAPARAAEPAEPVSLYRWDAQVSAEAMAEEIEDNLIKLENLSETNHALQTDIYSDGGKWLYYVFNISNKSRGFGLPWVDVGSTFKSSEALYLSPREMTPVSTAGYAAVNLDFGYAVRVDDTRSGRVDQPLHTIDQFEVQVSLDGTNFINAGAGMRSWKLVGLTETGFYDRVMLFELQTENLLDIPGVNPGDVIRKIRIRPYGEYYGISTYAETLGFVQIYSFGLNGYRTQAEWQSMVPERQADFQPVSEETMRQTVMEYCRRLMDEPWTADEMVYSDWKDGKPMSTVPGVTYHGPLYGEPVDSEYETFVTAIENGKYVGGRTTNYLHTADNLGFVFGAMTRVSHTGAYIQKQMQHDKYFYILGNLATDGCPVYTDTDIFPYNSEAVVYQSYAMLRSGDFLNSYTVLGTKSANLRVVEQVETVRGADGKIDPDASTVSYLEQFPGIRYYFRQQDGTVIEQELNTREEYSAYAAEHPELTVLYGSSARRGSQTFRELYNGWYVACSLLEYKRGSVEKAHPQFLMQPADGKDIRNGFKGGVASDWCIQWAELKLEDRQTGAVLYQSLYQPMLQSRYSHYVKDDRKLNGILAGLSDGDYRISMTAQTGPVITPGDSRPIATGTYDFTIRDNASTIRTTLNSAPTFTKGQNVDVTVRISQAYRAADIQIKYDREKLSFVGGTCSADFGAVTEKQGVVQITAAGEAPGQLAVLTFHTNKYCSAADVLELRRADVVPVGEVGGIPVRAMTSTEIYPSVIFNDVMRNAWYRPAVDFVYERGVMSGYYGGSVFGSDDNLSRAMVVQVLYNKEQKPGVTAANPFRDIVSGQWYCNAVRWGVEKNVVAGYGDVFKPDDSVTLEEVAVILHNYAGKPASRGSASSFGAHSDWAAPALAWAAEKGIFGGMPAFSVTAPATRAQTAQMLMNFLKNA